jgi:RNA polymerase sigma-70 factor (ECF subfamily)
MSRGCEGASCSLLGFKALDPRYGGDMTSVRSVELPVEAALSGTKELPCRDDVRATESDARRRYTGADWLMDRVGHGDVAAFESLYASHHSLVFGIGLRLLGDEASAEDLTQTVFLKVWADPDAFKGGFFAAWLSRVARNAGLDALRLRVAHAETQIAADMPLADEFEDGVIASLDFANVRDALALLPTKERTLIEMGYFSGLTYRRLAEITRTPLGTVKTRIRSGLHRLRRSLGDKQPHNAKRDRATEYFDPSFRPAKSWRVLQSVAPRQSSDRYATLGFPVEHLVECACGHGVGEHSEYGCGVLIASVRCSCDRTPRVVIEEAIVEIRRQYAWLLEPSEGDS